MRNIRKQAKFRSAKIQAPANPWTEIIVKRLTEGGFVIILAVALFLFVAFITYHEGDAGWSHTGQHDRALNAAGKAGAWFADFFLYIFGYLAYLFPSVMLIGTLRFMRSQERIVLHLPMLSLRAAGFLGMLLASCGLAALLFTAQNYYLPYSPGGIIGSMVAYHLDQSLNYAGSMILLMALLLGGITLLSGVSWLWLIEQLGRITWLGMQHTSAYALSFLQRLQGRGIEKIAAYLQQLRSKRIQRKADRAAARLEKEKFKAQQQAAPVIKQPDRAEFSAQATPQINISKPEPIADPLMSPKIAHNITDKVAAKTEIAKTLKPSGEFPNFNLLDNSKPQQKLTHNHAELEGMSREVEQRLLDFGVKVQVVAVHPGPVITRFELQLAAGIKASKITGLARDLARSLSVTSVRVVEVIPGKPVVGIELPNVSREIVRLHEVLVSNQYAQARSPLSLALGVDISGHPVVVDLAKMPHLLVAGTTGSGKSVGINAMLLSFLYKATPEQVRLILIDPKMLELSVYDNIPHLLTPVVTDMKDAANSLRWAVAEMERRYRLMAQLGVRNITGFNQKVKAAQKANKPIIDPLWQRTPEQPEAPELETLAFIVIVIDELADMMMVVGKKVEQLIARIAQKARAAGIHLILATQRPSVDVLTGLIKSNVPTRISFQVSSKIDSRTILDQQGAETLLGHGDMLYLAPGTGTPVRIHGAFVDDHEVHNVTNDWKQRGTPNYIEAITSGTSEDLAQLFPGEAAEVEDSDPLYDEAVQFVMETRKASISSVQRKLKIGYNRAARLIEEMERTGLVGPMEGGSRDVLIPSDR